MSNRFFHRSMAGVSAGLLLLAAIGLPLNQIAIDWAGTVPKVVVLSLLLLVAWFYHRRNEPRLRESLLCTFWFILLSNLYMLPMYMAARRDVGLSDELLASIDRALGVDAIQVALFTRAHPPLEQISLAIYLSLVLLMLLAILVPPLRGEPKYVKEFAVGSLTAAAVSIPMLLFFQAMGPWYLHKLPPDFLQAQFQEAFFTLKKDEWFLITFKDPPGLMTFPSFHAILALLSAWALRGTPYLRWFAAVLAFLICLTTLTTGWHYLTDVLGGVVVSGLGLVAERLYARLEAKIERP